MFQLFFMFLKVGFLGFGGGYAMLALIYQEGAQLGMTVGEFVDMNALDALIPGPIAINSATYVGQYYFGFLGGLLATATVSIPSLLIVPLFMKYERSIHENRWLKSLLDFIKIASIGLLFGVAFSIMLSTSFGINSIYQWQAIQIDWLALLIVVGAFVLHIRFKINPVLLTGIAAIIGYISYYFI